MDSGPYGAIRRVEKTGSTNEDVAALLGTPQGRGLTIVAEFQDRGTGRKGRAWIGPRGSSLLFTTALPRPLAAEDLWCVTLWAALCVRAALLRHGVDAQLQWPNDLLLHGRKLCGILCVSRVAGVQAWVGCGVGINVRRSEDPQLRDIVPPPAFCSDVADVDREALLRDVLECFQDRIALLDEPRRVAGEWEKEAGLGEARYRLQLDATNETFDAIALRLAPDGALVVRDPSGAERTVSLADARVLRDAVTSRRRRGRLSQT